MHYQPIGCTPFATGLNFMLVGVRVILALQVTRLLAPLHSMICLATSETVLGCRGFLGAVVAGTFAFFMAVAARPSSAVESFAFLVLLLFFFGGLVESLVSLLPSFEPLPPVCLLLTTTA